jgi:hypothetical protein
MRLFRSLRQCKPFRGAIFQQVGAALDPMPGYIAAVGSSNLFQTLTQCIWNDIRPSRAIPKLTGGALSPGRAFDDGHDAQAAIDCAIS